MDIESIMLMRQIRQRKTDIILSHLYIDLRKPISEKQTIEWWLQGLGGGEIGEILLKGISRPLEDE